MNNRSYVFWLASIIGVFIGVYLYFQYIAVKKEQFTVAQAGVDTPPPPSPPPAGSTPPSGSTPPADCPVGNYSENILGIPYSEKMKIYLSSFSDRTKDGKYNVYCSSQLRWYDLKDASIYFNIATTTPPSNILNTGLPLKNITLIGPPSEYLSGDNIGFELKPFTVFFYASLVKPVFANETEEITIFRLYAETPNGVRLLMKSSPKANHTRVQLIIGSVRYKYTWDIVTTTLISNGNPSIYAITFDTTLTSTDKVATFYVGKSQYVANASEFTEPIKLSNSRMEINSFGKFDAILHSFGFIEHKLTSSEIETISNYMYHEKTGATRDIANTAQSQQTEFDSILDETLREASEQIDAAKAACTNVISDEEPVKQERDRNWKISVPGADTAIATDTDVCSGLKIKGAISSPSSSTNNGQSSQTSTSKQAPAPAPAPAPTYKNNDYNISYPAGVTDSTLSVPVSQTTPPSVLQNTTQTTRTYERPPSTEIVSPSSITNSTNTNASYYSYDSNSNSNTYDPYSMLSINNSSIDPPFYDSRHTDGNEPQALDASFGML